MRLIVFCLVLLGLASCHQPPDMQAGIFEPIDQPFDRQVWQQIPLIEQQGFPHGKFIAILWASWCPTCLAEHGYMVQLASQGVPLVGITFNDRSTDSLAFIRQLGNPYTVLYADQQGALAEALGGRSTPTAFIFDSKHHVRARIIGGLNQRRWEEQGLGNWFAGLE